MRKHFLLAGCLLFATASGSFAGSGPATKSGVLLENMDRSVAPCQNFYDFANGTWLKKTEIPADESSWGVFNEIGERNRNILREILIEVSQKPGAKKGSIEQLIGDFYYSAMDTNSIELQGLSPLQPGLSRIAAMRNASDLQKEIAYLHSHFIFPGFAFFAGQDAKNSKMVIGQIYQSGIGLPDRDYYFNEDASTQKIREEYRNHVRRMFELMGESREAAQKAMETVMEIETRLAKASMTNVEQRDPNATYHKVSLAELEKMAPEFNWKNYLSDIGVKYTGAINVAQPAFIKEFASMSATMPLEDWKTYLRWNLVSRSADFLSRNFMNEDFNFFQKVLRGTPDQSPRWKNSLEMTDRMLGEALGQLYVKRAFTPEAKAKMLKLVDNLKSAMRDRLNDIDWLGADTRKQALQKLNSFTVKIGYPDKWRDYSRLTIDRGPYVLNAQRLQRFGFDYMIAKIGKAPDRSEWQMSPPTVNAYYDPSMNEIVFPAGILQPPFFDPESDDAVNYGRIGAVIGHEITHGFDDQGSQFDGEGNLKDWWSESDKSKFEAQAKVLEEQFSKYMPIDTMHINGKLTLGENIADLGGLKIAYRAYQKALKESDKREVLDGFTSEQRFFIGFAQAWSAKYRDAKLRMQILTNPHSPPNYRVIGTLSNMPEFWEAFGCKVTDPVARPESEQAKIW